MKHRIGRVEQEVLRQVNDILLKRVRDPRVQGVTITGVEMSGDLQHAKIFYSILSDKARDVEKAQAGLDKAKGLIRSEISARIKIYKVPEITFIQDSSVQYGERIDELIRKIHQES